MNNAVLRRMNVTSLLEKSFNDPEACLYFIECDHSANEQYKAENLRKSLIQHRKEIQKIIVNVPASVFFTDVGQYDDKWGVIMEYSSDKPMPQEGWDKIEEIWTRSMRGWAR